MQLPHDVTICRITSVAPVRWCSRCGLGPLRGRPGDARPVVCPLRLHAVAATGEKTRIESAVVRPFRRRYAHFHRVAHRRRDPRKRRQSPSLPNLKAPMERSRSLPLNRGNAACPASRAPLRRRPTRLGNRPRKLDDSIPARQQSAK